MKRPSLILSKSIAASAVSKGLRVKANAMPERSLTRLVEVAAAASGINGVLWSCAAIRPSRPMSSCILAWAATVDAGTLAGTNPQYSLLSLAMVAPPRLATAVAGFVG